LAGAVTTAVNLFVNLWTMAEEHYSLFTDYDIHLFKEGKHFHLWEKMGAHILDAEDRSGVYCALWAPNAKSVHVSGTFCQWDKYVYPMQVRTDGSGIWETVVPLAMAGDLYKFILRGADDKEQEKSDPFAFFTEVAPGTASVIWDLEHTWEDAPYLKKRKAFSFDKPISIYEVHLGSWGRPADDTGRFYTYRELAETLVPYVKDMGFTHVEFMPVTEHPFYGSWGYQTLSYFAPTGRYGTPTDLMYLIDALHKENIGVILDWVPSHFPDDAHGLVFFDGTHVYEHEDRKKGFHPDWNSYIFNYGRYEVKSFLVSSALFWLKQYHMDGLRVDAVASMLYLDYSRKEGEWIPNEFGGNENLEAIQFIKLLNETVYSEVPGAVTIAEESTAWPKVSKPTYDGGLGFGMKWMMGWMHDTLKYFSEEPIYRKHHQDKLTFSMWYAFSENFMLPLSHDEVVYGKGSLWNKMPGDEWHKFANLRLLYSYMFTHSFPKLIFMGGEFAQRNEWNHDRSLDWHLVAEDGHAGMQKLIKTLNGLYTGEKAMHEQDHVQEGFTWLDIDHRDDCILVWKRQAKKEGDHLIVVGNFDQQTHIHFRVDVPDGAVAYTEVFNSDSEHFYGSGLINPDTLQVQEEQVDTAEKEQIIRKFIEIRIAPLSLMIFKPKSAPKATRKKAPPKKK
ncbi:MAG: 1,4-alpha-glucan branching protein GlgB, partial [Chitinophagales bacterium]